MPREHSSRSLRSDNIGGRINWAMFWTALAALTRGLYYIAARNNLPPIIDMLPREFVLVAALVWTGAGLWALVAAFWPRLGGWPALAVGSLCVGWAACYFVGLFTLGGQALSDLALYVVVAGLVLTKTSVVVITARGES